VKIKMQYSEKFKSRMVSKLVGPDAVSANTLSAEIGITQPTLSRWLREARTVPGMTKKTRRSKERAQAQQPRKQRPQDWSAEQKLRVVVQAMSLNEEELGVLLRKEGLHQAQLDEWSAAAQSGVSARKGKKTSAESKRIRELERELRRKEKALAEAAALLILKKKVQAIWGDEDDDTNPRSGR
jgi:transposase